MVRLSIIVPVYNVEAYVQKCLESCVKQNLPADEYEIIVIIDGATDNSKNIVESVAKQYDQINVYYQENKGLSATRNRGVTLAKGKFIWFVDSDDWIDDNCLSDILLSAEKSYCDVLCQTRMYKEGDWNKSSNYHVDDKISSLKDYLWAESPNPAQFYIFKKSFLEYNNLRFKEGIKHEDSLFTPVALCLANKIAFYRNPVYHFMKRSDSITTVYDSKRSADYQYIVKELYDFMQTISDKELKDAFGHRIASIIKAHIYLGTFLSKNDGDVICRFYRENKQITNVLRKERKLNSRILCYIIVYTTLPVVSIYRFSSKIKY